MSLLPPTQRSLWAAFLAIVPLPVFLCVVIGFAEASASGRPNVIKIRTPNLDRFAREGVRLTRFYCQPLCCPTRAGLMTGRYHYRTGVLHSSRGGAKMRGNEVTVAELLAKAGYATGIFGKWHLGNNYPMRPQDQGFDEVLIHRSGAPGQPRGSPLRLSRPTGADPLRPLHGCKGQTGRSTETT